MNFTTAEIDRFLVSTVQKAGKRSTHIHIWPAIFTKNYVCPMINNWDYCDCSSHSTFDIWIWSILLTQLFTAHVTARGMPYYCRSAQPDHSFRRAAACTAAQSTPPCKTRTADSCWATWAVPRSCMWAASALAPSRSPSCRFAGRTWTLRWHARWRPGNGMDWNAMDWNAMDWKAGQG